MSVSPLKTCKSGKLLLLPQRLKNLCDTDKYISMMTIEKWNISCHINKQRMLQSLAVVATVDGELVSPERTKEGKNTSI